jgi:AraC-like DNA-binding protein
MIRWYYSPVLRPFLMSEDTYDNWVILAASSEESEFRYRLGDEEGIAKYGDIVLCPPGSTLHREADKPLSFLFMEFEWNRRDGKPLDTDMPIQTGKITFHRINRFSSTMACIRELNETPMKEHFGYKEHLLDDLLYLYANERWDEAVHSALKDTMIREAVLYIQKHAFEPLSLKLLADRACLSQSQFSRRFQAATGKAPIAFLTAIRMRKARTLLLESDHTLEQIAHQCGYQNGFYLSRVFTTAYDMSPSAYRKAYRI